MRAMADPRDETSDPDSITHIASTDGPVATIDNFRVLERVGEGGMGEVWVADQLRPIRRRVAIKIIKAGMDTADVIARFETERQVLALMSHPAIAQVFDAGMTSGGRPYFVMEYVPGEPLTGYCARHRLSVRARLDLLLDVCSGIEHAHQKGIIHRDLKPSNILVMVREGKPVAKIIDFGVAKATTRALTDRPAHTQLGLMIGTLEYMSPEQAEMSGLDVDTRTDVYALGVILYELLTGTLPFDRAAFRDKPIDDVRRAIREVDPPRPSTRATAITGAATPASPAPMKPSELRGDLDWITMRALEKDRTRRYASVSDFAADLRRHLDHEPVIAGPPSTTYRARKFVRRHAAGVSVAAGLLTTLTVFAGTTFVQARRIAAERDRANKEAEASRQISDFLTGLFRVSDPVRGAGGRVTARELLDHGAATISGELAGQPEVRGRLMYTMANAYIGLGLLEQASPLVEQSLQLRQQVLGPNARETLQSINLKGRLLMDGGHLGPAESILREAVDVDRRVLGPDDKETLTSTGNLGGVLLMQGRYAEAEPYVRQALEGRRRILGASDPLTLGAMNNLAVLLEVQGKLPESERLYREALAVSRSIDGPDHPRTISVCYNLARLLQREGRLDDAEPFYREALAMARRRLGDDHPESLKMMAGVGWNLARRGHPAEAEPLLRQALEGRRRAAPGTPVAYSLIDLATVLNTLGRYQESEKMVREGLQILETAHVSDYYVAGAMATLGAALVGQKKLQEAEPYVVGGYDRLAKSSEVMPYELTDAASTAVTLYTSWGKADKAVLWRSRVK
jgi:non-specific serine/threonine protein kinase/serine/threonine-protein kinase